MASVNVTTTFTFDQSVLADMVTHWLDLATQIPLTVAAAQSATDTTLTVSSTLNVSVGTAILLDAGLPTVETQLVTGVSGAVLTVSRGPSVFPLAVAQAHAAGGPIAVLQYADPYQLLVVEAIMPWAQKLTLSLGSRSAVFGYSVTGSVST